MNAEFQENTWNHDDLEFGSESNTIMIFRIVIYGLKSSSAAFHAHLADNLNTIGFLYTQADPDIWYCPAVKTNSFEYYEYILCYVDNILCISHNLGIALGRMQAVFKPKGDKIEQPEIYLGEQSGKMIVYGLEDWYMSAEKYVRAAVESIEKNFAKSNQYLPTSCKTPIIYSYRPETDASTELKADGVKKY